MTRHNDGQTIVFKILREGIAHIWTNADVAVNYLRQLCIAEPDTFKYHGIQDVDGDHVHDFSCPLDKIEALGNELDELDNSGEDNEDCVYKNDKVNGREVYGIVFPMPKKGIAHILSGDPETIEYLNRLCEDEPNLYKFLGADKLTATSPSVCDFICPLDKVEVPGFELDDLDRLGQ